jgi:tRNA threonylcarbamoyl adenosine modification protein YeaZ
METSSPQGSAALLEPEGNLWEETLGMGTIQGQSLAPCVERLLHSRGLKPDGIGVLAVGLGPGSYTGLRVGIALARAFAFATERPLVGISSFAALALAAGRENEEILVVCKADQENFYHALFRIEGGRPRLSEGHGIGPRETVLAMAKSDRKVVGPGAEALLGTSIPDPLRTFPGAAFVARLGLTRYQEKGASLDEELQPLYLRRSKAEINWDRKRDGKRER